MAETKESALSTKSTLSSTDKIRILDLDNPTPADANVLVSTLNSQIQSIAAALAVALS